MKLLLLTLCTLLLSTNLFAATKAVTKLDETNISKMLDSVKIAKEHKNIKAMQKYFLARTPVSLTTQDIEHTDTKRLTFNEYKRYLTNLWRDVQSNLIEVKERSFNIEANGRAALVKTTIVETVEIKGVKTETTVYETTGISLQKGKIYINYYSARKMLNTSLRVN